jgi:hypothetical protein
MAWDRQERWLGFFPTPAHNPTISAALSITLGAAAAFVLLPLA